MIGAGMGARAPQGYGRLWKFKLSEVDAWVRAGGAGSEGPDNRGGEAQG